MASVRTLFTGLNPFAYFTRSPVAEEKSLEQRLQHLTSIGLSQPDNETFVNSALQQFKVKQKVYLDNLEFITQSGLMLLMVTEFSFITDKIPYLYSGLTIGFLYELWQKKPKEPWFIFSQQKQYQQSVENLYAIYRACIKSGPSVSYHSAFLELTKTLIQCLHYSQVNQALLCWDKMDGLSTEYWDLVKKSKSKRESENSHYVAKLRGVISLPEDYANKVDEIIFAVQKGKGLISQTVMEEMGTCKTLR